MKETVTSLLVGALETFIKGLLKGLEYLEIRAQVENNQTIT